MHTSPKIPSPSPVTTITLLLAAVSTLLLAIASAQDVAFDTVFPYGERDLHYTTRFATDNDGNSYILGRFYSYRDFDPDPDNEVILTSNGGYDIYLQKFDGQGQLVWVKSWGGTGSDVGWNVKVDSHGNVYSFGGFFGTVDFDPDPLTESFQSNYRYHMNSFVQKLDSNGNFLWAGAFAGGHENTINSVAITDAGDLYLTGRYDDEIDLDFRPHVDVRYHSAHGYICKINKHGSLKWSHNHAYPYSEMITDNLGNLYITGHFYQTIDLNPDPNIEDIRTSQYIADGFVVKFDPSGAYVWGKTFGGETVCFSNVVRTDAAGNIYLGGYFTAGTTDLDPGEGVFELSGEESQNYYLLKLNPEGEFITARSLMPYAGLEVDSVGNLYTAGIFRGSVDFDPDPETEYVLDSYYYSSRYLSKLDPDGNFIWAKAVSSRDNGWIRHLSVSDTGDVYFVGDFEYILRFSPESAWDGETLFSHNDDTYLLKTTPIPPSVYRIRRTSSEYTIAQTVSFSLEFYTPVSGVDVADVSLISTGLTGPAVLGVSGQGRIYTVEVDTGTGDGTLSVGLLDDDSIVDTVGVPMGGVGISNGDFSEGEVYVIDKSPPTVALSPPSRREANGGPVVFDIEYTDFYEAFPTVDDVTLNTTGDVSAEVVIRHSDSRYSIMLSSIEGTGTVGVTLAAGTCRNRSGAYDEIPVSSEAVTIMNHPPVLEPIGPKSVRVNDTLYFTVKANDPNEDDDIIIRSGVLPAGASFSTATNQFIWTPGPNDTGVYEVQFIASDNDTSPLTDRETVPIYVGEVNIPPLLDPIGTQTVEAGETVKFRVSAYDADGDALYFSAKNMPFGAAFDPVERLFLWKTDANDRGLYSVEIRVVDDGTPQAFDAETITIAVGVRNLPPEIEPIAEQVVREGDRLTFSIEANDSDGDSLRYYANALPLGSTFDPATRVFEWVPAYGTAREKPYRTKFFVVDDGSPTESTGIDVKIYVVSTNRPPVLDPFDDIFIGAQEAIEFVVTGSDPDELDTVTYTVADLPTGATYDSLSNRFSWTPEVGYRGVQEILLIATDNGSPPLSDTQFLRMNVGFANHPPVFDPIELIHEVVPEVDYRRIGFQARVTDMDYGAFRFVASNKPKGNIDYFDEVGDEFYFNWYYPPETSGVYTVNLAVSNIRDIYSPRGHAYAEVTLAIGDVNTPPVLDPIGARRPDENGDIRFVLTALSDDNDLLTYEMPNLPPGARFRRGIQTFEWTPETDIKGVFEVEAIVTDNGNPPMSDHETVRLIVGDVNVPPQLRPIGPHEIDEGEELQIFLSGTDDDGDGLEFSHSGIPPGSEFIVGTYFTVFKWTPDVGTRGVYEVTFTVTDDGESEPTTDSETITITVGDWNRPPVLKPVLDREFVIGQHNQFTITASDPDGNNLTYIELGLPNGATFNTTTQIFSWMPNSGDKGDHEIVFRVSDHGEPEQYDMESITLRVKEDPSGSDGACFIATAAYGTPLAQELQPLRHLRDRHLLTNPLGHALTDTYYRLSPPLANLIAQNGFARALTRALLTLLLNSTWPLVLFATVVFTARIRSKISVNN